MAHARIGKIDGIRISSFEPKMELIPAVAYPTSDLSSSIRIMKQETCNYLFS